VRLHCLLLRFGQVLSFCFPKGKKKRFWSCDAERWTLNLPVSEGIASYAIQLCAAIWFIPYVQCYRRFPTSYWRKTYKHEVNMMYYRQWKTTKGIFVLASEMVLAGRCLSLPLSPPFPRTQFCEPVSMPPKCSNNVMRLRHLYQAVTLFPQMNSKLISCNCKFDSKSRPQAFLPKVLVYDLARVSQPGRMTITR
jgi:hypothetical protein